MLTRRNFIQSGMTPIAGSCIFSRKLLIEDKEPVIMTVNGPIVPSEMKFCLPHEHVMVDFIGADQVSPDRYNRDDVFQIVLPYLQQVKEKGCHTLVECTPAFLGRDVRLLKRLSRESGLQIITNTGYYGATREKFLPPHAYHETAEQLAQRWINEWKNGIDGTEIKPGFIKTSVDSAPLSAVLQKIIDAAAITHLATGMTIGVHTGNGEAAMEQLHILEKRKVSPEARIWIHAQNEKDRSYHISTAQRDGWVEFDGVNAGSLPDNIQALKVMKEAGLLHRVLVSQDAGWYNVGDPGAVTFKNYNFIFTDFIPALKKEGFTQKDIDIIFINNPSEALKIRVRKITG